MITKIELGRRLREARIEKGLTLKQLDNACGFSATHISEIERGKTSPTIGALIRIAGSLGKEPSYFIEEHLLAETSLVLREQRESATIDGARVEILSPGIPGGRLYASLVRLGPGDETLKLLPTDGEEGGYVVQGRVLFQVGAEKHELGEGDAIHHGTGETRSIRAIGGEEAALILVGTRRISGKD